MKKRKEIKLDDKEISIKELTIKDLIFLCHRVGWFPDLPDVGIDDLVDKYKDIPIHDLMLSFASDLTAKDVIVLAPSELKVIYDVFMEVNEVTFSTAKFFGLDKILGEFKTTIVKGFVSEYVSLMGLEVKKIQSKVTDEK